MGELLIWEDLADVTVDVKVVGIHLIHRKKLVILWREIAAQTVSLLMTS